MLSIRIFFRYRRIKVNDVKLYKASFTFIFYLPKPFNCIKRFSPKITMVTFVTIF